MGHLSLLLKLISEFATIHSLHKYVLLGLFGPRKMDVMLSCVIIRCRDSFNTTRPFSQ